MDGQVLSLNKLELLSSGKNHEQLNIVIGSDCGFVVQQVG